MLVNTVVEDCYDFLKTLANDVITDEVSPEFLSLGFLSEPMPFHQAPEDTFLLVMSDLLYACSSIPAFPLREIIVKGTVLAKVSQESKEKFLGATYGTLDPDKGLTYSVVSFFKARDAYGYPELVTTHNHMGTYSHTFTDGLVVPIADVLVNGEPVFEKLLPAFMNEGTNLKLFLAPFSQSITVVVSDSQGREYRRSWENSLSSSEAIRRTLDSVDLFSRISDVAKVEIFGAVPLPLQPI